MMLSSELPSTTLAYVERMRLSGAPYGRYLYAQGMAAPVLYASTYAAMTRHLFGELDGLGDRERCEWIGYLQAFQDDDGLFRDPAIYDQGWYTGDPEWCGRRHLSCHVSYSTHLSGDSCREASKSDYRDPSKVPNGYWNELNLKSVVSYERWGEKALSALRAIYAGAL